MHQRCYPFIQGKLWDLHSRKQRRKVTELFACTKTGHQSHPCPAGETRRTQNPQKRLLEGVLIRTFWGASIPRKPRPKTPHKQVLKIEVTGVNSPLASLQTNPCKEEKHSHELHPPLASLQTKPPEQKKTRPHLASLQTKPPKKKKKRHVPRCPGRAERPPSAAASAWPWSRARCPAVAKGAPSPRPGTRDDVSVIDARG